MQSINAGFQSLKTLIPHSDGEKLSKVSCEQQLVELSASQLAVTTKLWCLFSGCHPAADSRVHFYVGAGEDTAIAAEQSAEANHTGGLS